MKEELLLKTDEKRRNSSFSSKFSNQNTPNNIKKKLSDKQLIQSIILEGKKKAPTFRKSATSLWGIMPITEVPSPAKEDKHEQIKQKEKEDSIETSFESIDSRRKEEMRRRRAKFDMQKLKYHKIKEKNDHLHSQLQQILRSIESNNIEKKNTVIQYKIEKHKRSYHNIVKLKQKDLRPRVLTPDRDNECINELRK